MKYFIYNETDEVYAYPEPVSRRQARRIIKALKNRYGRQGYYASVRGHIPVSALSLVLLKAE